MQKLSLQTHDYDGHLGETVSRWSSVIQEIQDSEKEVKDGLIRTFIKVLENRFQGHVYFPFSRVMLQSILSGGPGPSGPNWDPSDQVSAYDLLCIILTRMDTKDPHQTEKLMETLYETLRMGQCAQGRVKRLMGFLNAYLYDTQK